jgi:hypothetical protein
MVVRHASRKRASGQKADENTAELVPPKSTVNTS